MKLGFLLLIAVIISVSSCDKETSSFDGSEIPSIDDADTLLPDEIIYYDLIPNVEIVPCDSIASHPYEMCMIPYPADSTVNYGIDIDNDNNIDYNLIYCIYYEFVSASSPCANYKSYLKINGVSGNELAVNENDLELTVFDSNDTITTDTTFRSHAYILVDFDAVYSFNGFNGGGYIGIKLSNGSLGWIRINMLSSIYSCIVFEYAYNQTINNNIVVGG